MRKAVTLPSTSRDWTESAALARGAAQMKRDREAKALSLREPREAVAAHCGSHLVQRSCSSTCVALIAAPDASVLTNDTRQQQQHSHTLYSSDRVHFGWLCVDASANKRAFRWRFCVVDGAHLSLFRDDQRDADCLGHHALTSVRRLHRINRGLELTDDAQRVLWAHADHKTEHFEAWLDVFRVGIQFARQRRDGSIFERPLSSATDASSSASCTEHLDASVTGWLLLRWRRLGLFSSARRHYVVLSGRHLSAFALNLEGERAKVCGRVVATSPHTRSHWLSVTLEGGQHLRLASPRPEATASWLTRMQRALETEQ